MYVDDFVIYCKATHLIYVDDLVIYCKAATQEATKAIKCLRTYCEWTEQEINWNKSPIHFSSNVTCQLKGELTIIMGMHECKHKGRYLGHPFCQPKTKTEVYKEVLEKWRRSY